METEKVYQHNRGRRALGGIIVVAVGLVILIRQLGIALFPSWLFTWPMLLIVIGIYVGTRKGFNGVGWLVCMLIGGVFLVPEVYPGTSISQYVWPILLIVVGVYMILRPKHRHRNEWSREYWQSKQHGPFSGQATPETFSDDYIDLTSTFGGVHKVIVSKNFKGGDIVNIFGGCDLNLSQADFEGTVTLDIVQIFGGAQIIVPNDWKIVSKMTSVFGGIEDKRSPSHIKENPAKTLVIDGTSIFAGITIQSH